VTGTLAGFVAECRVYPVSGRGFIQADTILADGITANANSK
jgi:hypothetical protein